MRLSSSENKSLHPTQMRGRVKGWGGECDHRSIRKPNIDFHLRRKFVTCWWGLEIVIFYSYFTIAFPPLVINLYRSNLDQFTWNIFTLLESHVIKCNILTHATSKIKKCNDYHIPSGMFDNKANYSLVHLSPPSAAHKENCRGGSFSLVLCNHVHTKGIIMGAIYQLIWILENPLSSRYSTLYRQLLKIKINLYYSKWC